MKLKRGSDHRMSVDFVDFCHRSVNFHNFLLNSTHTILVESVFYNEKCRFWLWQHGICLQWIQRYLRHFLQLWCHHWLVWIVIWMSMKHCMSQPLRYHGSVSCFFFVVSVSAINTLTFQVDLFFAAKLNVTLICSQSCIDCSSDWCIYRVDSQW